jgi:hypothetical protein
MGVQHVSHQVGAYEGSNAAKDDTARIIIAFAKPKQPKLRPILREEALFVKIAKACGNPATNFSRY